jgi:hypothetical protein
MELWEKLCAYIPRKFVVVEVIKVIEFVRSDHSDHSDHSSLGRVLWPEDLL